MTAQEIYDLLQLNDQPKRVLIVEDDTFFARQLRDRLVEHGHDVIWFVGLEKLDGSVLTGWGETDLTEEVDLRTVQVVFQDHYFPSRSTELSDGTLATRTFKKVHPELRVFGMSSVSGANASMAQAGAVGSLRKTLLGVTLRL